MIFLRAFILICITLVGCQKNSNILEPNICYSIPQRVVEKLPSAFDPLSEDELVEDWGKQLYLGRKFARELDLYRALTCFKSALFLIPLSLKDRQFEIEYEIFLAYYTGNKYQEAIEAFENSHLTQAPATFPPIRDLLIALYDSYIQTEQDDKASRMLCLIDMLDHNITIDLSLETAIRKADFPTISSVGELSSSRENVCRFLTDYQTNSKSVSQAQWLNAILPGAGYYYVDQKKSALTSLLLNTLFIAASYQLFNRGYIAAGAIVASLEVGWYVGGINGAGLAAKEYNERLYECLGKSVLMENKLFPILMLEMSF